MCPIEARVLIAEDDEDFLEHFKEVLEGDGHRVVIKVGTLEEGLTAIPIAQQEGVQVALVDGALPKKSSDGRVLVSSLRQAIPGIKIVDTSTMGITGLKIPPDVRINKYLDRAGIARLGKIVTGL